MKLSLAAARLAIAVPIEDIATDGTRIPKKQLTSQIRFYRGVGSLRWQYKREATIIGDPAAPDGALTMVHYVPLWPVALLCLCVLVAINLPFVKKSRAETCTSCGYDIRACAASRCSECGTFFDKRHSNEIRH